MKIGSIFLSSILVPLLLAVFVLEGDLYAAQLQQEIAVINMQKVVRKSAAGRKAMEKLNKKFEKLQSELKKKQEEIKAFKEDLEKKGPLMSEEARAEKEREYKKMVRDFKEQSDDAQYEMRQAESKLMEPIFKVIENLVNRIGKEKGYALILEKNMPGVYYTGPGVDITDDVIKAYDKDYGASEKK